MAHERIRFPGHSGEELAGRLELPDVDGPRSTILFAHCFTCSKDLKAVGNIAAALVGRGHAVLRFDFTGLGESEGDFADTHFSSNVDDLVAAARWLEDERGAGPSVLLGHSLGGAAVIVAAARLGSVRAVATIGAPSDPSHVVRLFAEDRERIEAEGVATVTLAGRSFSIRREFLEDIRGQTLDECLAGLGRPLLVFHSPVDEVVGIDNARRIYEAARHPKSFVSLDDADHLLTREADSRYVGAVLAAWATRYLDG